MTWLFFLNVILYLITTHSLSFTKSRISSRQYALHADNKKSLQEISSSLVESSQYQVLEYSVLFALVSGIDGGFSGDWSRYHLVSSSVEQNIRDIMTSIATFHVICAPLAAVVANSKKQPVAPAVLRTLLIGGLSLFRVIFQSNANVIDFPNFKESIKQFKQLLANKFAGDYNAIEVNQTIDDLVSSNPCVMYSFSSCPYCLKAKELLISDLGASVVVIELDEDKKIGYPIRAELGKRTGRTSVPSIWIGGQFIGGCNDGPQQLNDNISTAKGGLVALQEAGYLIPLFKKAGALKKKNDPTFSIFQRALKTLSALISTSK